MEQFSSTISAKYTLEDASVGHRYIHFILFSLIAKGVELVEVHGVAKMWVSGSEGVQLQSLLE